MSDGINQIVSEKLDKNNFHAWKFRMTNFLMGKDFGTMWKVRMKTLQSCPRSMPLQQR
jgi:hypothetical protein